MIKKVARLMLIAILGLAALAGCSQDSAEKIRYDMEKLVYTASRTAERINVQPELMTAADSLQFKQAYQDILVYYFQNRDNVRVQDNQKALEQMNKMAVNAQMQLARYYLGHRQYDSVLAAYRRIGSEIPADRDDLAGADLRTALTYQSLSLLDSTIAYFDKIIRQYYPPVDSLGRVNTDVIALPINKIIIARSSGDENQVREYSQEALGYYQKIKTENADTPLFRAATIYSGRVYAMNEEWDSAIDELMQIKDSTGQIEARAQMLIANIYNDSKNDLDRAVELYRQTIDRQPDSAIIGAAMLRLGAALCARKQYEEGRQVLADLKKKFSKIPSLTSKAQLFYAQAFEQEGRWERAMSEYQWLMENYPYTEEAFRAAWHIPVHFSDANDEKLADIWYQRAVEYYEDAISRKANRPIAVAASMFLADTYTMMKEWNKAIATYERIYSMVPRSRTGANALWNAAQVAFDELGDSATGQSYLDRMKADYGTTDSAAIMPQETQDLNINDLQ